jgi:hypothetical protein
MRGAFHQGLPAPKQKPTLGGCEHAGEAELFDLSGEAVGLILG